MMDSAAYEWWEAVERHELLIQRCESCNLLQHPPTPFCRICGTNSALTWSHHHGTGQIHALTQVHTTTYEHLQSELPYWIALIELEPNIYMLSNLVDVEPDVAPQPGQTVNVEFRERAGQTLPLFTLVSGANHG